MALVGITLNRQNPPYTITDFTFWMPQFRNYIATAEGAEAFDQIYEIVNGKIFYSIFGSDWKLAMSYAIAHYLTLIAQQMTAPSGDTLQGIAGGGVFKGVLASATIGGFSKSYELGATLYTSDESLWWNQTSYGAALMTLYKTKAIPSILVVTSNNIPGTP